MRATACIRRRFPITGLSGSPPQVRTPRSRGRSYSSLAPMIGHYATPISWDTASSGWRRDPAAMGTGSRIATCYHW